jgi:AcrR family transcriptional regulator
VPDRVATLRERQRLATKSEIVRIAFSLFVQLGYDVVSIERIAAEAGISRATFFNYFPRKDLILHELAAARAERVSQLLASHRDRAGSFTREDLMRMILEICAENARFSFKSKKLLLDAFSHQLSHGLVLTAREQAIGVLTDAVRSFIRDKKSSRLVAETLFCIFIGTMLEWLMREDVPEKWLVRTMETRATLLMEVVQ